MKTLLLTLAENGEELKFEGMTIGLCAAQLVAFFIAAFDDAPRELFAGILEIMDQLDNGAEAPTFLHWDFSTPESGFKLEVIQDEEEAE